MKKISSKIAASFLILGFVIGSVFMVSHETQATVLPIAGSTYTLASGGVSPSATSITLQSFTLRQTGMKILDSHLSDTFYLTIEPGNPSRQEIVSCTTATQNSNGTATLSDCSRGLEPIYPYSASTTLRFAHSGGSQVTFSDPPQFFNQYAAKENTEVITGSWTFPTPTAAGNAATKAYVDAFGLSGSLTVDRLIVPGTAGETVSAGKVVYLKQSDARWYLAGVSTAEASSSILAIAQGAGTSGSSISGGVLLHGLDSNQSGLSLGANYFLSSTAGTVGTATTTRFVGKARTATTLYFDTFSVGVPSLSQNNTWTGTNSFIGNSSFGNIATSTGSGSTFATTTVGTPAVNILDIGKNVQIFTANGTFTVPSGVSLFKVRTVGGGGSGGTSSGGGGNSSGGGSGGYNEAWFNLSATTSVGIIIGSGGDATGGGGADGGTTYFGGYASSTGGFKGGPSTSVSIGGDGGTSFATTSSATIYAINGSGTNGGASSSATNGAVSGFGAPGPWGGGGKATTSGAGNAATKCGAGGGGAFNTGGSNEGGDGFAGCVIIEW